MTSCQEAREWLREGGFDVVIEEVDRREELLRGGHAGIDANNDTFWAHLVSVRNPDFVVPNYGSGKTEAAAVVRARQR